MCTDLRNGCACTLDEVAAALGVTNERAYQIERVALRKFRGGLMAKLKQMGLKPNNLYAITERVSNSGRSSLARLK